MNDLLNDTPQPGSYQQRNYDRDMDDLEASMASSQSDPNIRKFFEEVNDIKGSLQEVKRKLHSLQDANDETKQAIRVPQVKAINDRMKNDMNQVLKIARQIKKKIDDLDTKNIENRKKAGCGAGTSTDRTRISITNTLKKKLKDTMNDFQILRDKIQTENKEAVERRFYTVTGQRPTAEAVDHLIETGESESIFQKAIQEQGRGRLLDTMAEIRERHDAVKDIERQLIELHQIFLDMAVLVETQGEMLEDIESQVGTSVEHVSQGVKELVVARSTQRNTRKWYFFGVVIIIVIIVVVVVVFIKPWNSGGK